VVKNKISTMMNGGVVCLTVRAGLDSLRWTLQWRPKSRACPGQWHGREGAYITVQATPGVAHRRSLYDTEAQSKD
jgi:hypothetical protein